MVAMRVQSVRFAPDQWQVIARASEIEGVTMAQFVRESAHARAVLVLLDHGDPDITLRARLIDALVRHPDLQKHLEAALKGTMPPGELRALLSSEGHGKAKPRGTRKRRPRS